MEICVWPKAWKLPSIDYKCLIVQAYIRFLKAPIAFQYCNNPWKSPNGDFPVLMNGGSPSICEYKNIIRHLQLEDFDLDSGFSDDKKTLIEAYKVLIEEKLLPALEYLLWAESKSFTDVMRPTFAKMLVIPLGLYIPIKFRNKIIKKFKILYSGLSEAEMENKLINDAKETINYLSTKLDQKDYMLGNKPCSIDAYMFGILAPLLRSPLPNKALINHIIACPNLVQVVDRILDKYFPPSQYELDDEKRMQLEEEEGRKANANDSDFPHKKRNIVIAASVCASSILIYAALVGILKFEIIRPSK